MASNLTGQVRNIADVTTAVANGDLSQKVTVDVKGEVLELKNTVNTMVDQLSLFADEVTRVAREVGTEGKLGGQAQVKGVTGVWKDLTENVNTLANNLTGQVRNIAAVTTAVANGDLSQKITVDVKGEVLELKETVNTMVDQLRSFSAEVTRVAKEVGTEGKLGGQAQVEGVSGVWRDLTENVNTLANNLTGQVRNIAEVTTAVANGDLSKKITVDVRGEVLELKETINTMVDQLRSFAAEVTRVAREVGTEGKLGGQAQVEGVVRHLEGPDRQRQHARRQPHLPGPQHRAGHDRGRERRPVEEDHRRRQGRDPRAEGHDQHDGRPALLVRSGGHARRARGRHRGQARRPGPGRRRLRHLARPDREREPAGANNLTDQVRNIARGDDGCRSGRPLEEDHRRRARRGARAQEHHQHDGRSALGVRRRGDTRRASEVGTEGKLGGQAQVEGVSGTWRGLTETVNLMADNLTAQVRNIAEVTTAVAKGDLTQKITVETKGEIARARRRRSTRWSISSRASQPRSRASPARSAPRASSAARRKSKASPAPGADLTDNVNLHGEQPHEPGAQHRRRDDGGRQGRPLAEDHRRRARARSPQLKETINTMVDQLSAFAGEVTRVAREVGTEGKLGGEAEVEGVSGVWRDLTENVNTMARAR